GGDLSDEPTDGERAEEGGAGPVPNEGAGALVEVVHGLPHVLGLGAGVMGELLDLWSLGPGFVSTRSRGTVRRLAHSSSLLRDESRATRNPSAKAAPSATAGWRRTAPCQSWRMRSRSRRARSDSAISSRDASIRSRTRSGCVESV